MMAKRDTAPPSTPGTGVDAAGYPVKDPSENVISQLAAEVHRMDDLREMESKYQERIATLRAKHAEDLREAEAKRIDAIRAVDVAAVQQAAQDARTRADTLAAQVTQSAEQIRNQVATTATAAATALGIALTPLTEAIADLRRVQYEQQGQRAAVVETRSDSRGLWALGVSLAMLLLVGISVAVTIVLSQP